MRVLVALLITVAIVGCQDAKPKPEPKKPPEKAAAPSSEVEILPTPPATEKPGTPLKNPPSK